MKLKKYKKNWAQIPFASRLPLPANARSLSSVRFANSSQILPSAQLHAQRSLPPPVTIPPQQPVKSGCRQSKKRYIFTTKLNYFSQKKYFSPAYAFCYRFYHGNRRLEFGNVENF